MSTLRPSASQLGTGALVVAALAVGQVLNDTLPDGKDGGRLFEQHGIVDQPIAMRTGELTVTKVEGATSILRESADGIRSPGVALVVHFSFVARGEPSGISYGRLTDGAGRTTIFSSFGQRNEIACPAAPVGLVSQCTAVVEADPDTLPGATLGLAPDSLDPRFDDMAVVDLGIDADDVDQWRTAEELPVPSHRVGEDR